VPPFVRHTRISLLGRLVLAGAVAHAVAVAVVFGVSWLDLPFLAAHHSGDGFWHLGSDARDYYRLAAKGVTEGLHTIRRDVPSSPFILAIAAWMRLFGVNPLSPLLLNLAAYIITCVMLVRVARKEQAGVPGIPGAPDAAIAVPVFALSASPVLLLCSTQIMKDMVFACAIAVTLLAIRSSFRQIAAASASAEGNPLRAIAPRLLWLWLGVAAIAGIRPYYAIFITAALALTGGVFVARSPRRRRLPLTALNTIALVLVAWLGFVYGSGLYYTYYRDAAFSTLDAATGHVFSPVLPVSNPPVRAPGWKDDGPSVTPNVDTMRDGFALKGGGTNLARPAASSGITSSWERATERARATTLGVAAMLVPISILQASRVVDITGGRGFLWLTDLDTLFLDATAIAVICLLVRHRRALVHDRAYLSVCLILFAMVLLMCGYVLTNLGMIVRLRVIAFVPLWMATLAISRPRGQAPAIHRDSPPAR
jgi:hypothetical protein